MIVELLRSNEEVAAKKLCYWAGEMGVQPLHEKGRRNTITFLREVRSSTQTLDASFYSYLLQLGYSGTTKLGLDR